MREDYKKYHELERYVFDTVAAEFHKSGNLNAFDFFCIIIWKANRAKSKIADLLLKHGNRYTSLEAAVVALTREISDASDDKDRMRVLIKGWKFRLPIASAILTVLYPDQFTVYDYRVCQELGEFRSLSNRPGFDKLWAGYVSYIEAVVKKVPDTCSLRDKDRWLWGKSFHDQLTQDISKKFNK